MRQSDFESLALLATMDRAERERLLLSADRFLRAAVPDGLTAEAREQLLERFGLFGIRLGVVLIRAGFTDPTPLAHELARRSGLDPLLAMLAGQFHARADALKARTALVGMESLLRNSPREGSGHLAAALERLEVNAHEFRELRLLAMLRTTGVTLKHELAVEAERIVGGEGVAAHLRMGLQPEASPDEITAEAHRILHRWRLVSENPLTDRSALDVCRVVVRSCEGVLAESAGLHLHWQPA
jgi:hypothetical protein